LSKAGGDQLWRNSSTSGLAFSRSGLHRAALVVLLPLCLWSIDCAIDSIAVGGKMKRLLKRCEVGEQCGVIY